MLGKILTFLGLFFWRWHLLKSAQDVRLLSANYVINWIFKMALRLIKRVYRRQSTWRGSCLGRKHKVFLSLSSLPELVINWIHDFICHPMSVVFFRGSWVDSKLTTIFLLYCFLFDISVKPWATSLLEHISILSSTYLSKFRRFHINIFHWSYAKVILVVRIRM